MNLFIGGLPYDVEEDEHRELFEEYGQVSSVKLSQTEPQAGVKALVL